MDEGNIIHGKTQIHRTSLRIVQILVEPRLDLSIGRERIERRQLEQGPDDFVAT